jgi:hypothetical protein
MTAAARASKAAFLVTMTTHSYQNVDCEALNSNLRTRVRSSILR